MVVSDDVDAIPVLTRRQLREAAQAQRGAATVRRRCPEGSRTGRVRTGAHDRAGLRRAVAAPVPTGRVRGRPGGSRDQSTGVAPPTGAIPATPTSPAPGRERLAAGRAGTPRPRLAPTAAPTSARDLGAPGARAAAAGRRSRRSAVPGRRRRPSSARPAPAVLPSAEPRPPPDAVRAPTAPSGGAPAGRSSSVADGLRPVAADPASARTGARAACPRAGPPADQARPRRTADRPGSVARRDRRRPRRRGRPAPVTGPERGGPAGWSAVPPPPGARVRPGSPAGPDASVHAGRPAWARPAGRRGGATDDAGGRRLPGRRLAPRLGPPADRGRLRTGRRRDTDTRGEQR